jgi:hypothetical protein
MVELSTTYSPAILCHSQEAHSKSPANRYQTVMQLWLFGIDKRLNGIVPLYLSGIPPELTVKGEYKNDT